MDGLAIMRLWSGWQEVTRVELIRKVMGQILTADCKKVRGDTNILFLREKNHVYVVTEGRDLDKCFILAQGVLTEEKFLAINSIATYRLRSVCKCM